MLLLLFLKLKYAMYGKYVSSSPKKNDNRVQLVSYDDRQTTDQDP